MHTILNLLFGVQTAFAQTSGTAAEKDSASPFNILAFVLEKFPLWITAIVVFVFSLIIGVIVKKIVESRLASKISEEHQEVLIITGRVTFLTVATVGTALALAIAGINITTLLAAIGFGISFGLQDTISNFVAGLAILASRPFTIGDWIKINGNTGKVTEIRTRATYLRTFDGLRLIVPNAELYKSQVLSYTSNPLRRLKVPVYCRYGVNMEDAYNICFNELKKDRRIFLEPKPNIVVTDLADSYISLEVRFWVDSKGMWRRIQSKIFMKIQNQLEEAGMDAPYAVTSLSLESDFESAMIKTHSLDGNELTTMMNARMAEEEKIAKKRQELSKKPEYVPTSSQPQTPDESGGMFLKASEQVQEAGAQIVQAMTPNAFAPQQEQVPVQNPEVSNSP